MKVVRCFFILLDISLIFFILIICYCLHNEYIKKENLNNNKNIIDNKIANINNNIYNLSEELEVFKTEKEYLFKEYEEWQEMLENLNTAVK